MDQDAEKGMFLDDNFKFGVGPGQAIDQDAHHSVLMQRSTDLGKMLDAGRARRNQKDR